MGYCQPLETNKKAMTATTDKKRPVKMLSFLGLNKLNCLGDVSLFTQK
jgi:hypothetical protein